MSRKRSDHLEGKAVDIRIKLLPRSSMEGITGREGEVYRVKVTSPPVDGKANNALISFLSKRLGIAKGNIKIIAGKGSRMKLVRIHGLSSEDIAEKLDKG